MLWSKKTHLDNTECANFNLVILINIPMKQYNTKKKDTTVQLF